MSIELQNLFPEEISDEAAFNLVELFSNITAMMESHYCWQIRRHFESIRPCYPPIQQVENNQIVHGETEDPF